MENLDNKLKDLIKQGEELNSKIEALYSSILLDPFTPEAIKEEIRKKREDQKKPDITDGLADLFDTNIINETESEIEEEDIFPEKLHLGFCKYGALSKKRKIFWEIQLFAFPRSFKDGIRFFCMNINWDRYISEHTPSFEIELTILNCYNSFKINKYNP